MKEHTEERRKRKLDDENCVSAADISHSISSSFLAFISVDSTPIYSAVQSLHNHGKHRTRLAQGLQRHLCAPEQSLSSGLIHDSSMLVSASLAVLHEHFPFLTQSSFYHDTRPRTTMVTTRSTPRTPSASSTSSRTFSRKATPSRISGAKTCRVAETRAKLSPQVMSPRSTSTIPWKALQILISKMES